MSRFVCLWMLMASVAFAQDDNDSTAPPLRLIAGGRFIQGTDGGERALQQAFPLSTAGQGFGNAESPAHPTWITKPFFISTTEVTVGQFNAFVQATGYQTTAERGQTEMVGWDPTPDDKPLYQSHDFSRDRRFTWKDPGFPQTDRHPVVGVSWQDAKAYCRWLGDQDGAVYRLPTEAEWEFACRAGTSTWFSFGDSAKGVAYQHANFGNVELEKHRPHAAERQWLLDWDNDPEDGNVFTAAVGSYQPNAFGIHDMHGNVWEWCEDLWLDTVYKDFERPKYDRPAGTAVDPVNRDRPQTDVNDFHTIRGGSWYNGDLICRSANRTHWDAEDAACYIGFRIVREADPLQSTTAREAYQREQATLAAIKDAGGELHSSDGLNTELRLEAKHLDRELFRQLALLPDLNRLSIRTRQRDLSLTQSALDTIADLNRLREVDFQSGLGLDKLDLSPLCRLTNLETLKFSRQDPLNDVQIETLSGLTSLVEFECFGIGGGLTDSGIQTLAGNRQLRSLKIWENQASGDFLAAFQGCPLQTFVCTARNGDGAMTEDGANRLSDFGDLRVLALDQHSNLHSTAMQTIGGLSKLRQLGLRGCTGLRDSDFRHLAGLTELRELDLMDCGAGNQAAEALVQIPRLESLKIGNESIGDSSPLDDSGLAALSHAFSIERLELGSNAISDKGIEYLGRINRLRWLTVTSQGVTGSGLGPLTLLPNLQELSLRTPGLTDVAFEYLATAKQLTKVKLAHRGVQPASALTNQGLMKMAAAVWLRELWVARNDTQITEDQIKQLDSLMPKTNVIPYTVTWE
ncbi:SUMF1/EgtB/PvdO family nonheme iron enzyme [Stieleria sp. TO1_6]|uniref:SUMF1/EgtB/PvdO family nonheme iron enzyme n=1 Tax=Stieleria tagensis TaxID=2956795 RepID=UPI00209B50A4|nr:SUMF1/EgtB/PvdO family nonheme iron enzyme [Stieleria tagensis]MCO8123596.1 SUMF1/EgtB/PvdO family nonheme iron enzyme [Stieleria tagensis]